MLHANIQNINYASLHPEIVLNSFSDTMFLRKQSTTQCKIMAQTLPQRKLPLSIIVDPMHQLSSNMTQNDCKNNATISNKKPLTTWACIMHAFVCICYHNALNVINFVQNYLFEHSLVCFCSPIHA